MNILLTSAGRRTYMVDWFKEALSGKGLVFASNSSMSPALLSADEYVLTPLIYDAGYIDFLKDYCREKEISLIVPLFDIDLPVLSKHRDEFAESGVTVLVSDMSVLSACNDKYEMSTRLWKEKIRCPHTVLSVREALLSLKTMIMSFPVIVKPRFGMGSVSVIKAFDKDELKAAVSMCRRGIEDSYLRYESAPYPNESVIIQELREGDEYGLDIINDLSGNFIRTVVKRKLAMRAGETDEALILGPSDKEYETLFELGKRISESFRHIGNMDVDVIMQSSNMWPYVIDMNARFGGGYPFSHMAGIDLPRAIVSWMEGKPADAGLFSERPHTHGYKDIEIKEYVRCR